MAYEKHIWTAPELITKEKLNNIEGGIEEAIEKADEAVDGVFVQTPLSVSVHDENRAIMYNTGKSISVSGFNASDYVDISGWYAVMYKQIKIPYNANTGIAFYSDADEQNYLSGVNCAVNRDVIGYVGLDIAVVPEGAKYVRFTMLPTDTYGAFEAYGVTRGFCELNEKQDKLTFDDSPTASSDNPVKSGGIKSQLDILSQNMRDFYDSAMDAVRNSEMTLNMKLLQKQDTLTFDTTPTAGSDNPVKSSGIKTAIDGLGTEVDDLKSAMDYAVNAVDNRVSNDELYDGYQNKVPTFEHGYVNTSGEYTDETQRYITGGLPTAENTKVVNHSAKSVFVVYFSAFTDFSDFTYGTYVTVASGNELTLATQYPYFAVQGTNNTLDVSEFRGVYIVGTSELEYLSYANLHDVPEMRESLEDLEKFQKDVEPTEIKIGKYTNTAVGHSVAIYDSAFFALGIFDAKPNTKYSIQTQGRTTSTKYVMFADSNNIVLEWHEYTVTTTGEIITDDVVSPPTAAKLYIDATDNRSGSSASQYIKVKESLLPETTEKSIISDEQMRFIASAQRRFTTTPADNYADNRLPTFVHVTDIHGDSERFANAVDLADLIHADAVLNTGDSVAYNPTDSVAFLADKMADATVPMLPLIGNHESYTLTEQQMYTNFIQPFSTGLVLDSSVDYSTYYYRDFATHKIRVIGINQFQYRGVSNMTTQRNYHQAQINFLCNALLNAPDDYGIIIMLHTPEAGTTKSAGYTKFYQDEILYNNTGASIKPIYEIVDAYISGTAINKTFDNISGNSPATFTVNANFSGKNNSEFIAYVSGHAHRDSVYYLTDVTNKQLMLNAVCTNSWTHRNSNGTPGSNYPYYCELTDLPRVIGTDTENAVNVYTIDRINKTVRIVRYGSDTPYNFSERRDYMVIPYAD